MANSGCVEPTPSPSPASDVGPDVTIRFYTSIDDHDLGFTCLER